MALKASEAIPWEENEAAAATAGRCVSGDEELQPFVVEQGRWGERGDGGVAQLGQRGTIDGGAFPIGQLVGVGHGTDVIGPRRSGGGHGVRRQWGADEQRRMTGEPPAATVQVRRRPGTPQMSRSEPAAEEALDSGHHRVPVGRRAQQHRTVEEATRAAEIGHRHVIGIQCPATAGERESGTERSVVVQEAAQQRVADGDLALPTGNELRLGEHEVDGDIAHIARRSHADCRMRRFDRSRARARVVASRHMRVRILGALELIDAEGNACPIGSANQRTVLAALLARRGEVVTIDALIDALWGDAPPASAVSTLRTYVSRLRSHLGSALTSRGGGFAIDIPPDDDRRRAFRVARRCGP